MKKTLENLTKAFISESQARNRYSFYASIARKEGYEQIAAVFALTSDQEKEHAKRLFEHIQELKKELGDDSNKVVVESESPNVLGTTIENLKSAMAGENYEHTNMYPEFAQVAEDEGLEKIAVRLRSIAIAEQHHEERYAKLLKNLEDEIVFKRGDEVWWICRECGYMHFGTDAPKVCPSCDHDRAFYEVKCEEY